jgi:XTP/dITP diphosphohydrolase
MEIFLASGNGHKRKEFAALFPGHSVVIPGDRGFSFAPEETGNSFAENCLIKARALFGILRAEGIRSPVLADDSGLCVDILGGRPGILTSRYGGDALSQAEKNRMLVEEVNAALLSATLSKPLSRDGRRSCRYVCALALYAGDDRFFLAQETMEGEIVERIGLARGAEGFGYDPVVYLKEFGRTVAELPAAQKNEVSHRGKAARALMRLLEFPSPADNQGKR